MPDTFYLRDTDGVSSEGGDTQALHSRSSVILPDLLPRDAEVVKLVGDFGQASASQIKDVLFASVHRTMVERSLERLARGKFLRRLGRRPAGDKGGSGAFVWQLGVAGWHFLGKRGKYAPRTAIDYHALAVLDIYVALRRAEADRLLRLTDYHLEHNIDPARADLAVVVAQGTSAADRYFAIEVEVTRKRPSYIIDKMDGYCRAFEKATSERFPIVVLVVPHGWMRAELEHLVRSLKPRRFDGTETYDPRELFRVCVREDLIDLLVATT